MHLKLRLIYALHMILPLALSCWLIRRLEPATALALANLFRA